MTNQEVEYNFGKMRQNLMIANSNVEMPGGYYFNHFETLRKNNLSYEGKFESGDKDTRGNKKYFYNVIKPACDVAAKFVDLDTKDIIIYSELPDDQWRVWIMSRDLRQWMKDNHFGQLLNELGETYPKSHVVVKRFGKAELKRVPIENLRFDPSVSDFRKGSFVYEINPMDCADIALMNWNGPDLESIIARGGIQNLYECYDRKDTGKGWERTIVASVLNKQEGGQTIETPESSINNPEKDYMSGEIAHSDEIDELPYWDLKWESVDGRCLARTLPEYLRDNQVRKNEIINQQVRASAIGSVRVFQTRDQMIQRNIMTDAEDGDILTVNSELTAVPTEARNLPEFNIEHGLWDKNTDQKSFNFDISRGENLPSGTPLGIAQIQAGMVESYFAKKKENFGLFVKTLLLDAILPEFEKYANKEHSVRMTRGSNEVDKLHSMITEERVRSSMFDHMLSTGKMPSQEEMLLEKSKIDKKMKNDGDLVMTLPKNFYKDLKYGLDILVTGEQKNVAATQQTLANAMSLVANPAIMNDERARTTFFWMLELAGISPVQLGLLKEKLEMTPPSPMSAPQGAAPMAAGPTASQGNPVNVQ